MSQNLLSAAVVIDALRVCHFPIGILGQVWYLIVSIPDLCNLTYFKQIKTRCRCGGHMSSEKLKK